LYLLIRKDKKTSLSKSIVIIIFYKMDLQVSSHFLLKVKG